MRDRKLNGSVLFAALLAVFGGWLTWHWGYPAGLVAAFALLAVAGVGLAWRAARDG